MFNEALIREAKKKTILRSGCIAVGVAYPKNRDSLQTKQQGRRSAVPVIIAICGGDGKAQRAVTRGVSLI